MILINIVNDEEQYDMVTYLLDEGRMITYQGVETLFTKDQDLNIRKMIKGQNIVAWSFLWYFQVIYLKQFPENIMNIV